jgi:hypothetical protein
MSTRIQAPSLKTVLLLFFAAVLACGLALWGGT